MTDEQLIADLQATFPGILAKPAAQYKRPEYQHGVWVGGEATIGELPIFQYISPDPDDYNGNVLHGFEAWLEARGYWLEHYDVGVYFALPWQPELPEVHP
jgi:hypothetical protein